MSTSISYLHLRARLPGYPPQGGQQAAAAAAAQAAQAAQAAPASAHYVYY